MALIVEELLKQIDLDCVALDQLCEELCAAIDMEFSVDLEKREAKEYYVSWYTDMREKMDKLHMEIFKAIYQLNPQTIRMKDNSSIQETLRNASKVFDKVTKTNFKCGSFCDKIKREMLGLW